MSLVLYPSTAEDSVSQFVRLTLTLTLDQQVHPPLASVQAEIQDKERKYISETAS